MSETGECGKSAACSLPANACPMVEAVGLTQSVAAALADLQKTVSKSVCVALPSVRPDCVVTLRFVVFEFQEFRKALRAFSEYISMIEADPAKGACIAVNCVSFRVRGLFGPICS
jgi:hypothetical protein